jgi:hypothetical protein
VAIGAPSEKKKNKGVFHVTSRVQGDSLCPSCSDLVSGPNWSEIATRHRKKKIIFEKTATWLQSSASRSIVSEARFVRGDTFDIPNHLC